MDKTPPNRRASRRLSPRGRSKVVCRKGALDLGPDLTLALLDLSETGIRLVLRQALDVGQEVFLTFEAPGSGRRLRRLANVVWSVPAAVGGHCTGLHFQKALRYLELDYLAKS